MNMNDQIELLAVTLPEDIQKYKYHGDFPSAIRAIDRRLAGELPDVMRRRLLLEKKLIRRLPGEYPYSEQELQKKLAQAFTDVQPDEVQALMDSDSIDWIYIDGKPFFHHMTILNLLKTREDYTARKRKEFSETDEFPASQNILTGEPLEEMQILTDPADEKKPDEKNGTQFLKNAIKIMRRDGEMNRTIRLRAKLTLLEDAGVEEGEHVRVYLPLPGVDAQVRAVRILDDGTSRLSSECLHFVHIAGEDAPARTICWEVSWRPGMTFQTEYEYDICATYVDLWQNPPAGQNFHPCLDPVTEDDLAEQAPHIVFSPLIRQLAAEIIGNETDPLEKARRIYNYVTTKVKYSFVRCYAALPPIPDYVASGGKGDCGVQALLFITLCRCAKIPARWQSGLYANPADVGCHDWARFYVPDYGWLFADCSFGGSAYRAHEEERRRFYFGNLEPFRMPSCRQFQAAFEPPMEKLRNDPYDAQTGEIELERDELHDRYPYRSETIMTDYRAL